MPDSILTVPEVQDEQKVPVQRSVGRIAAAVFLGNVATAVFFGLIYGLIEMLRSL